MTRIPRALLLLTVLLGLSACATAAPSLGQDARVPGGPVVLISIDGFHPAYLDRGVTPNLAALAARGVQAEMKASFPTKTFPNHYTLVTGLRPDRHGIIDNVMTDPALPGRVSRLGDRHEVTDPVWWNGAMPIWVSAERAGLKTATLFWPGSEAPIAGVQPSHWMTFDQTMSAPDRVARLLAWLDVPKAERPVFLTLYFDEVDTYGPRFGPDSPELDAALARTDAAIGQLVAGLKGQGLLASANLIVVSDHGMAATSRSRIVRLEDLVSPADGLVLSTGPHLTFEPAEGRRMQVEAALLRPHPHMECWRKGELPERLAFGHHPRVASLFCLAQTGWEILPQSAAERRPLVGGAHGYDPADPAMASIFIAAGPAFRSNMRIPTLENVDVYPLLARLLALAAEPNQGDPAALEAALTQ
ncbi:MAG: ectonucleotide pyrophosphatase/phosphodiesterase [Phenylobacterium sp.]|uniref:alkaline phosphatase family protein n=1 Tax=Phenylobacterium sp. TaxID=1871053 RepID=UPI0025E19649|nr:ectonucleotide pyrophosphatase/phosphodiesterase [Phenylobacterium sp.]MCG9916838.1 ectonucleotide pyrophosphatase/phosphodiesterase [Phenylobacterium sp.]